jgi:hypothetical protein
MQLNDHVSCHYSEEQAPPQASLAGSWPPEEDSVVRWRCPRCGGITVKRAVRALPGKGIGERLGKSIGEWLEGKRRPDSAEAYSDVPFVVTCDCGQRHPGRPPSARHRGCGASWFESAPA